MSPSPVRNPQSPASAVQAGAGDSSSAVGGSYETRFEDLRRTLHRLRRSPLSLVGLAIVLGLGLPGAWAAFALDLCLRGLLNSLRFRAGHWKAIKV